MSTFADFWESLKDQLHDFAEQKWKDYLKAAVKDGESFLENTKADLERWTRMVASGDLTQEELSWLVIGKKDLTELLALKKVGLSKIALEHFWLDLVDFVVTATFKAFV